MLLGSSCVRKDIKITPNCHCIAQGEGWPLSQMERSEKLHDFSWNVKKMPLSEKWSWAIDLRSCPCHRGSYLWIRAGSVWANSKIRASVQESTLPWEQTNICVVERELPALWGKQHTFVVLQSAVQTLYWLRWALHLTLPCGSVASYPFAVQDSKLSLSPALESACLHSCSEQK